MSDFKFSIIQEYAPFFLSGTWLTIKLSLIAILCGFLLGLVLALSRISKKKWQDSSAGESARLIPGRSSVRSRVLLFFLPILQKIMLFLPPE